MVLENSQITAIECLAWDVLVEAYFGKEIVPPIDINLLIEKSGLELRLGFFKNSEINGVYDKPNKVIYINKQLSYTRQVFTVAHELGHYYLHQDKEIETFYRGDIDTLESSNLLQEQEANWFAASLLMPKPLLKPILSITKDIAEIARRFSVSSSTAYYRLKNLGFLE